MQNEFAGKTLAVILGWDCQLRCAHCMVFANRGHLPGLTEAEFFYILRELNTGKFTKLILTGGEPLLYLSNAKRLIETVRQSFPISALKIEVLTNGAFLTNTNHESRIMEDPRKRRKRGN